MSSNRAMELFQELAKVEARRDELRSELGGLLGFSTTETTASGAPVKSTTQRQPRAAGQRTVKVTGEDGAEKTQPSLKQVVQGIVSKHPDGIELRAIVNEVNGLVERKEYFTKAKSITAVVSQAVNQLTQDNAIVGEKSPETKRNKYKTVAA